MKLSLLSNIFKLFTVKDGAITSRFVPTFFMGGGSAPSNTTSTVNQTNVPNWAKPQAQQMLAAATKQLFQTNAKGEITGVNPYVPYSTNPADYVSGFSPMQQQAFAEAANMQMPGQFAQASDLAARGGYGGLQSAQQALGYGNAGFQSGQLGQQFGLQSAQQAQNMANYYGGMGANYGQQAANLAGAAQGYGAQGAGYGNLASQLGLQGLQAQGYGMDVGQQARDYAAQSAAAGQNYLNQIGNPSVVQQYMSPYQQNVTDLQKAAALREFQVGQQMRQANAARSGAYGGARQAIENAEAQRNLNTQLQTIEAQGLQNAYNQALVNIGQGTQYGLSGLSGAQSGLNTALQGGQLGLSGLAQAISGQNAAMQGAQVGLGGVNAANQAYQTGIQGANTGLSGVGQFIQGGQLGLQGTAQGMQGAGYGLQGVSGAQQGYQLANQAAQNLSGIGTAQQAAQTGIIGLQNQLGGQQQANQQDIINAAINNYAQAQNYPMQQLQNYNALIRGLGSTQTTYAPGPSVGSQLAGAGMSAAALYGMMKAEGGKIEEPKTYKSGGLVDLAIANVMGNA